MLLIFQTHPIQYHAPLYRHIQQKCGIPIKVIYGSDFSVAGYADKDFSKNIAWDTELLDGYESIFSARVAVGGAKNVEQVKGFFGGALGLIRKIKPQAILICGYVHIWHLSAYLAARFSGIPIIFRGDTADLEPVKKNIFQRRVKAVFLTWFYRGCRKILYIGKSSRRHFEKCNVPTNRLIFSPYCAQETQSQISSLDIRTQLGISKNQYIVLFAGKLITRKGCDLLIQAVKFLPAEMRRQICLLIVGDGPEKSSLEKLTAFEPEVTTIFAGFKNQTEIPALYVAADLAVVPSRDEIWGIAVNEALMYGLPCLVSDRVCSHEDLIIARETGLIFKSEDIQSLADGLQDMIGWCRDSLVKQKCQDMISKYSISRAAEGIVRAYREIIEDEKISQK